MKIYAIEHSMYSGYFFAGFDEVTGEPTWFNPKEEPKAASIVVSYYLPSDNFDIIAEKISGKIVELKVI
jgi:hypothetical protein